MDIFSIPITVAGCGSMGLPMARVLHRAGFNISGFDIRPVSDYPDFADKMLGDSDDISKSKILISVVRDAHETLDLCFDDQAVYLKDGYPEILVLCSTLSPRFVDVLVSRLPSDVALIDAPMSGAPIAAEQGRLSFMLGGHPKLLDSLTVVFDALGERTFRCGGLGAGMTYKLLNNYVAAGSVIAVRRAYEMARILNVDLPHLREVMSASSGATWFGNRFDEIAWAREGYESGNTIGILEKDVLSALDAIKDHTKWEEAQIDFAILEALRELERF